MRGVQHLFSDFLDSDVSYKAAEDLWRSLVERVAHRSGTAGEWSSWQTKHFLDGSPEPRDGNPIFEARCDSCSRAIRIIQHQPESNEVEIAAWVDTFDFSSDGGLGFTEELIVNLSLSSESARLAERLIELWMDRSVSRERMEDVITRVL